MKLDKSLNFNFSFTFDKNLTEVPNDIESFYKGILHLEKEALNEKNKLKRCRVYSRIGVSYRIYGDNSKSEKYLLRAIKLIDKSKNKAEFVTANIRLAHTYQKQQKFDLSARLFTEVETFSKENDELKVYLDFVYQHIGKLKFDQKKYKEALIFFKKAMKIRKTKGDKELITSTEFAVRITKEKINIH